MNLKTNDPEIYDLIKAEEKRQVEQISLIPSENEVSAAVKEAVGSVLMNKYSEGQPGKRYYQGNQFIDAIESLAESRALSLFNLDAETWHVNVQPVTGSLANFAAYAAVLKPGDKILAMSLYDGGHLTHGWKLPDTGKPISFTSRIYDTYFYNVDPQTRVFDYTQIEARAKEVKPRILISGGTAYPREIDHKKMRAIADSVGAIYMADVAHEAGLIAGGANQSPFPYAHLVTMTTRKTLRGPVGAMIFANKKLLDEGIADAIDFAVFPALQGGPQNHSIAGIAVALHEAAQPEFNEYAKNCISNAQLLASELARAGFDIVTGGTDKHLILIDLRNKGISGKEAAEKLEAVGIIANKNTVPGETGKPWNPSGLRLGTPTLTSRNYTKEQVKELAQKITKTIVL